MTTTAGRDRTDTRQREDASIGDLIREVSQDVSTMLRQEIELAKAEVREEAKETGKAAGMLGGAGFAGVMVAVFASLAALLGLANVMDAGWAALIVTGVWALAAAALFVAGRSRMRQVTPKPERTIESMKENAQWVKHPTK